MTAAVVPQDPPDSPRTARWGVLAFLLVSSVAALVAAEPASGECAQRQQPTDSADRRTRAPAPVVENLPPRQRRRLPRLRPPPKPTVAEHRWSRSRRARLRVRDLPLPGRRHLACRHREEAPGSRPQKFQQVKAEYLDFKNFGSRLEDRSKGILSDIALGRRGSG